MTPEVVKFSRPTATGSDCWSRDMVVISLFIQLLISRDIRASDVNEVHYPLKQAITGARIAVAYL